MKKNLYKNTGITLIALIVTIIVMLILTSVSISMTLSDGIFDYAQNAVSQTENSIKKEQELINNVMNNYFNSGSGNNTYEKAEKDENGFLISNATYTSGKYTAVIPAGFKISEVAGEDQISTGLVIKDANENEFVWIPVTKTLNTSYTFLKDRITEPALVSDQDITIDEDITVGLETLKYEYTQMVNSVNEYNGFYIGRYETTWQDGGVAGTVYGGTIANANVWVDLYTLQKETTYVTGNGINVQTAMIYGVLWDETLAFMEANDLNYSKNTPLENITICEGNGETWKYSAGTYNTNDFVLNIWGMGSSFCEWTQEVAVNGTRIVRGTDRLKLESSQNVSYYADARNIQDSNYGSFYYARNENGL